jgi:hypothetical protein
MRTLLDPKVGSRSGSALGGSTSCLEHALALGSLDLGPKLLALAHKALVPLELTDNPVLGDSGSEPLEQRIKGLTTT